MTSRSPRINYIARVIFRGPGILSSFCHPSRLVSLVLQNLIGTPLSSYGHTKSVFSGSESALHPGLCLGWAYGVFHAVSFRGSHSMGWSEVSFSFVPGFVAKTQGPSSLAPQFAGFIVPAQPKARQSQWETVISCAGSQVLPGPLSCASSAMRAVPFLPQGVARRSYRRPLSPSGSGYRCHGCAGSRLRNGLFFVSLELGALVLSLRLFLEKNFAVILVGGRGCGTLTHPCGAAT